MPKQRQDPDKLLKKVEDEEKQSTRGHLKIFFGACAGVGKTYAMLQAAKTLRTQNVDVVVGLVETHGRAETAELLKGLEILPQQSILYRGKSLSEFDLDAALKRKPALILIDELAHSNKSGSRHVKRWQDVEELLNAGISVYSTLNVQHLESLNDVVGNITGVRVLETIPEHVFDHADEITLVDLPPDELLKRLREGKIYIPEQIQQAVENFFRKGNLIALRELALRRMADRVDAQMREYRADQSIQPIWQTVDRIMVCVGPSRDSATLIRKAYRLATHLHVDWLAVYGETPALQKLSKIKRNQIFKNLKLAQELGAETKIIACVNLPTMLLDYGRGLNVSKILVGKTQRSKISRLWQPALSELLTDQSSDIDIYIMGYEPETKQVHDALKFSARTKIHKRGYIWAFINCALMTFLLAGLQNYFSLANLAILYFLPVTFIATCYGRWPGIFASLISVAAFDFFFVPPKWSFSVSDSEYLITFIVMLIISSTISHLAANLRYETRVAMRREQRTYAVYALSKELASALTTPQAIEIGIRHLNAVFQSETDILLPDSHGKIHPSISEDPEKKLPIDIGIAQWTYDHQEAAGWGTQTLPASNLLYLPLRAPTLIRGVVALRSKESHQEIFFPEQQRLLDNFLAQIASTLERIHYTEVARDTLLAMELERLRYSLEGHI